MADKLIKVQTGFTSGSALADLEAVINKHYLKQRVILDFKGTKMNNRLDVVVARLIAYYGCDVINFAEHMDAIQVYLDTRYFIKAELGVEKYVAWLTQHIYDADFPLMIMDNRLKKASEQVYAPLTLIKPLVFEHNGDVLQYQRLKIKYTEPHALETAVAQQQPIWLRDSLHMIDMALPTQCIRFAANAKERTMIDLFNGILTKNYTGFASTRQEVLHAEEN